MFVVRCEQSMPIFLFDSGANDVCERHSLQMKSTKRSLPLCSTGIRIIQFKGEVLLVMLSDVQIVVYANELSRCCSGGARHFVQTQTCSNIKSEGSTMTCLSNLDVRTQWCFSVTLAMLHPQAL
ncbi:hypothetical protein DICVIV_05398 [Dictyocaulus viviparus]|uniref:Uncharacterized protein n=1 Tax=Dictyocaulus viviparus TaxID=29172 RepID=A0A0D8XXD8_DICVI|nr:hypothetical protein DICVIV_05398 [Dictyocaulus viviparus]